MPIQLEPDQSGMGVTIKSEGESWIKLHSDSHDEEEDPRRIQLLLELLESGPVKDLIAIHVPLPLVSLKLPRFDGHGNSNEKRESRWKRKEAHYL
jgi:hypothetical protein